MEKIALSFFFYNDIFFLKETHSDQIVCKFLVCIDPLVASENQVLRHAADVMKMIRIVINLYILKSAKIFKMPIFITAIVAQTYFEAG